MDLNIASVSAMASANQSSALAVLMLRKTLELQAQNAAELIQTIPQATPSSNPPNLGNVVDVMA